jgi:ribosome-binding factor A
MPSHRVQRVNELLKRALGEILLREIPLGDAGLLNIHAVDTTADLQLATVYVGVVGNAQQRQRAAEALEQHRKHIQFLVGRTVVLKYTPQLRFVMDDSIERGNKILKIIEEIENSSAPKPQP